MRTAFITTLQSTICNMQMAICNMHMQHSYGMDGYNHVVITRNNQNGGRDSLFICNEMLFSEFTEFTKVLKYTCIDCLFFKSIPKDISYVFGILHRPLNSDIEQFVKTLNDILSLITHVPCYITEDCNLDLLRNECHHPTEYFLNTMHSNSMLPRIYKPTRERDYCYAYR